MKPPFACRRFYALVFICRKWERGRSVIWCSRSGGAQRPLEAEKEPAGVWCDDTLQPLVCDSHLLPQHPSVSSFHLISWSKPTKRWHHSNIQRQRLTSCSIKSSDQTWLRKAFGIKPPRLQPRAHTSLKTFIHSSLFQKSSFPSLFYISGRPTSCSCLSQQDIVKLDIRGLGRHKIASRCDQPTSKPISIPPARRRQAKVFCLMSWGE